MIYLLSTILHSKVSTDINSITQEEVDNYYQIGWVGFYTFFAYNGLYILWLVAEVVSLCRYTSWSRVLAARKAYYSDRIGEFVRGEREEDLAGEKQQGSIREYIRLGNLLKRDPLKLKRVRVVVDETVVRLGPGGVYELECETIRDLFRRECDQE